MQKVRRREKHWEDVTGLYLGRKDGSGKNSHILHSHKLFQTDTSENNHNSTVNIHEFPLFRSTVTPGWFPLLLSQAGFVEEL